MLNLKLFHLVAFVASVYFAITFTDASEKVVNGVMACVHAFLFYLWHKQKE